MLFLLDGNTGDAFVIEEDSGKIYTKRPLDYETTSSYTLTVQATDGGGRSSTTSVTISLRNLDDNPPVCFPSHYHQVPVYENITIRSTVSMVLEILVRHKHHEKSREPYALIILWSKKLIHGSQFNLMTNDLDFLF